MHGEPHHHPHTAGGGRQELPRRPPGASHCGRAKCASANVPRVPSQGGITQHPSPVRLVRLNQEEQCPLRSRNVAVKGVGEVVETRQRGARATVGVTARMGLSRPGQQPDPTDDPRFDGRSGPEWNHTWHCRSSHEACLFFKIVQAPPAGLRGTRVNLITILTFSTTDTHY